MPSTHQVFVQRRIALVRLLHVARTHMPDTWPVIAALGCSGRCIVGAPGVFQLGCEYPATHLDWHRWVGGTGAACRLPARGRLGKATGRRFMVPPRGISLLWCTVGMGENCNSEPHPRQIAKNGWQLARDTCLRIPCRPLTRTSLSLCRATGSMRRRSPPPAKRACPCLACVCWCFSDSNISTNYTWVAHLPCFSS